MPEIRLTCGYIDADGYRTSSTGSKDMIIRRAASTSMQAEVEGRRWRHPWVLMAAVVGHPAPGMG